jgi:hypothetical protein
MRKITSQKLENSATIEGFADRSEQQEKKLVLADF